MSEAKKLPEESFEAGLERLKKLVDTLGRPGVSLDDALRGYEEGVALSAELSQKLTRAEARLEKLVQGPDGEPRVGPMDED
ncbi:MAG: exodeoxyribonuclease VII small subunit [Deltaproteobacteria bacterium]|jgi:exodeoxyribonuclease VII small subunit|nr:exodeoxyribonuclease VII small subunit [Deltaproteobacteria bacterium]MDR1297977.1 exodeoxyribonuclease VII small subunit [Deltaproteobacteria bacterium]